MRQVKKYAKSILVNKLHIVNIFMIFLLISSYFIWGESILSLKRGSVNFQSVEDKIIQPKDLNDNFYKYSYLNKEIDIVVGSYAEFRTQNNVANVVYYLIPIKDGNYFVTVIAGKEDIQKFDELEQAFYNSLGKPKKEYGSPFQVKGGLRLLTVEEKRAALEYFNNYNNEKVTLENLHNYVSPYVFVLNQIHGTNVQFLNIIFYAWIFLLILTVLLSLILLLRVCLFFTNKDIKGMDMDPDVLEEEFKDSILIGSNRLGKKVCFIRTIFHLRLYSYDNIIWIYMQEKNKKNNHLYLVYIYTKNGKKYKIYKGNNKRNAKRIISVIQENSDNLVVGYYEDLYDIWKDNKKGFYMYLKEKSMIQ